jgi:hypothetical protein
MKSINADALRLDQNELYTLVARLRLHAANLRGLLATSAAETISAPNLEKCDDFERLEFLTAHVTELEHRLGDSAPQFQFSTTIDAAGGNGPRPAGFGDHKPHILTPGAVSPATKKPTLTEKVLAENGVKTIAELNTKKEKERNFGKRIIGD